MSVEHSWHRSWSAEYGVLCGLDMPDTFAGDDVGAQNNLPRLLHPADKPTYDHLGRLTSPWHPCEGVADFLRGRWRARRLQRGPPVLRPPPNHLTGPVPAREGDVLAASIAGRLAQGRRLASISQAGRRGVSCGGRRRGLRPR